MIARRRGEHHVREIWQPRPATATNPRMTTSPHSWSAAAPTTDTAASQASRWRRTLRVITPVLAGGLAYLGVHQLLANQHSPLPATPKQWVDAYEAAAIDNPARVCNELFSPQLAAAYAATVHSTCTRYFARITSTSQRVRRILRDGGTAVVQLHETIDHADWNVVLERHAGGWRAVDLIPGRALR
jgi:hypothetical protein